MRSSTSTQGDNMLKKIAAITTIVLGLGAFLKLYLANRKSEA